MLLRLTKKLVVILILSSLAINASAQPGVAPQSKAFGLDSENLGAVANAVNVFTGDLALPLNLVSMPGRDASIDVSVLYSSANIENLVDIWNLDAPTSILGLGWSLQIPYVIVDNKQTGARDDDEFYLLEGGRSIRLINIGTSGSVKMYATKIYTNWIISFDNTSEKWKIVKEDGSTFTYGDMNSGRNTVQWIVKWKNWIGNSSNASSQTQQGFIWNLSDITTVWGTKITYSYDQLNQAVGVGGLTQTVASYPYKITGSWGDEVEFVTLGKNSQEYIEPHLEQSEPDAYQERWEAKYLDKILVRKNSISQYEVRFAYSLLGSGNSTKRLLQSIKKVASLTGQNAPSMQFDYLTSGAMKGALTKVTSSMGSYVSFSYSSDGYTVYKAPHDIDVWAPVGYRQSRVFIEDNYTVFIWRQNDDAANYDSGTGTIPNNDRSIIIRPYTWDGRWVRSSVDYTITNTRLVDSKFHDFKVVTADDFFAIMKPLYNTTFYSVDLWHKKDGISGEWRHDQYSIDFGTFDPKKVQLFAGNNFVAATNNNGKIVRYVWKEPLSGWSSSTVSEQVARHFTSVSGNVIISNNTGTNPDGVSLYYLDESGNWQSPPSGNCPFDNGLADSNLSSTPNFATFIVQGPEYAMTWSDTYTSYAFTQLPSVSDFDVPLLTSGSSFSIYDNGNTGFSASTFYNARFNGLGWNINTQNSTYALSIGDDVFSHSISGESYEKLVQFDANTLSWNLVKTSSISQPWTNNASLFNPGTMGIRCWVSGGNVYFRQNNGAWMTNGSAFASSFQQKYALSSTSATKGFRMAYIKNNTVDPTTSDDSYSSFSYTGNHLPGYFLWNDDRLVYGETIVSVPGTNPGPTYNVDIFRLSRMVRNKFYFAANANENNPRDYPILLVTNFDGVKSTYVTYDYAEACLDPSSNIVQYNTVTTIPGSNTVNTKPYGYTQTSFFNGLSEAELGSGGSTFYSNDESSSSSITNASYYYSTLTGQAYRTKVFDRSSNLVAETVNVWNCDLNLIISSSAGQVGYAFNPQLVRTIQRVDGKETYTNFGYGEKNLPSVKCVEVHNPSGVQENYCEHYGYWWQKYPSIPNQNILTPVAKKTVTLGQSENDRELSSEVTRFKLWPSINNASGIPGAYDSYTWKRSGTAYDFSAWDVSTTPPSNWAYNGRITNIDPVSGNVTDKQNKINQSTTQKCDSKNLHVIATTVNASSDQTFYEGFEEYTANTSNSSPKVGAKSFSGSSVSVTIPKAGNYKLTYWKMSSSSVWSLVETTVSASTSNYTFNLTNNSGEQIDEIRVHPLGALMTSYSFDPYGNLISVCDPNNVITYYEYDDFQRVKLTRDADKNIVNKTSYNFITN